MLTVNNLTKSYGEQTLFDDVSFVVGTGERVGLVGRNGHGKTTLFKMILGMEEPDSGTIAVPRHYRAGHLSQHIDFSNDTVLMEACSGLPASEDGTDESYKVKAILTGLGIPEEWFGLDPGRLSGGYQIRLNLAKVLASGPDLLLLDEPTNYLDIVSIRWLRKFLRSWRGELVLITHDREFMDGVSTHTMAIHRQKIRKVQGPTEKLYAQIIQEEEVYEQTRINDEKKRKEVEKFINRFRASATKARAVQSRIKALESKEKLERLDEIDELDFEFNAAPFSGKWLMEVNGLSFGYREGELLMEDLRLAVGKKDRIAIIGKNGKGKTTLLNLLAGEIESPSGAVTRHANAKMAYFGQTNINRLDFSNTIEEEIRSAHPDYSREVSRRICGAMMFEGDSALKKVQVLSGGEKSRVLLGKLLVSPANLLLLDEPTNHLDMESIDSLVEAIDAFDGAVLIVTHSEMILKSIANRLIIFDGGRVTTFEGTYQDFLDRVGWLGEMDGGAAIEAAAERTAQAKGGGNRKELRKLRAEILAEKNKAVAPLQKRLSEIEAGIISLEKKAETASQSLLDASQRGDAGAITLHSKEYHSSREKIDALFDELEALTKEHDEKVRLYDVRLTEYE